MPLILIRGMCHRCNVSVAFQTMQVNIITYIFCVCVSFKHADKIQHEFFLLFSVMDENESWYLQKNIERFGSSDSDPDNEEFQESNKMHGMHICVCVSLFTQSCTFTSSLCECTSLFLGSIIINAVSSQL